MPKNGKRKSKLSNKLFNNWSTRKILSIDNVDKPKLNGMNFSKNSRLSAAESQWSPLQIVFLIVHRFASLSQRCIHRWEASSWSSHCSIGRRTRRRTNQYGINWWQTQETSNDRRTIDAGLGSRESKQSKSRGKERESLSLRNTWISRSFVFRLYAVI